MTLPPLPPSPACWPQGTAPWAASRWSSRGKNCPVDIDVDVVKLLAVVSRQSVDIRFIGSLNLSGLYVCGVPSIRYQCPRLSGSFAY